MDRVPPPLHQPQPFLRHAGAAQEEGAAQRALRALGTRAGDTCAGDRLYIPLEPKQPPCLFVNWSCDVPD